MNQPWTLEQLLAMWWYYSIELAPGRVTKGIYPDTLPMLSRMMLAKFEPEPGMTCLDVGCMEGLASVLLARRGARVFAVDSSRHCVDKIDAVKAAYGVDFGFYDVHSIYDLKSQFSGGFDLINLSGVLYHVVSPLMVLMGIRPLLKRNGLLVLCTNVIVERGYSMEFNAHGRMQKECNTFWYPTIPLLEYWLRMLRLAPLDVAFMPHEAAGDRYLFDKKSGYLAVVCRAVGPGDSDADAWMGSAAALSVDFQRLVDWDKINAQPASGITYFGSVSYLRDLFGEVDRRPPIKLAINSRESHVLHLDDKF